MNICFVYKLYPIDGNYDSGIGKYLADLTSELAKEHRIVVLTTSMKPRVIKSKNLTIYATEYSKSNRRTLSFAKHLINIAILLPKLIKKHKIDIVEFVNWESEGFLFSFLPNRFLRIPVVVRLHTPSYITHRYNLRRPYFSERVKEYFEKKFVNQKENYLTASTNFNARECKKGYGIKKDITIMPLGIKPLILKGKSLSTSNLSTILYVGRLEARKGIDILIKAIPNVLSKAKNTRFVIVGRENSNHEWIVKLRNTIPYEYLDKVFFLGYVNNQKMVNKLYQNSDICVFPSRYESFGLTILEAMNFGKPVIASRVGGIPEIIKNGINGILIGPNSDSLSKNILVLLKNLKLRKAIGSKSLLSTKNIFSIKKLAENTINYYTSIISVENNNQI